MSLILLKEAIELRRTVSFEYKSQGERIGNPHAIYIYRAIDGKETTKVDIDQIAGVSSSGKPFPSFRMFDLDKISDARFTDGKIKFDISHDYKPESDRYKYPIKKV